MTFAEKILKFNRQLDFKDNLPDGIQIMNPFQNNLQIEAVTSAFYKKYYNDNKQRRIILGINPGRFGAGVTGIPFTDTKRLKEKCNIQIDFETHETSSVFIYDMIDAFGEVEEFYSKFYINSVCPLGFVKTGKNGKEINYNYYDSKELTEIVEPFIIDCINKQIEIGIKRDVAYCLGTGKNFTYLNNLNQRQKFFNKIIALEHPRFIMQYKLKSKDLYIKIYLDHLK